MLSGGCGAQVAGVRLVAGNYSVAPMPDSAFHIYVLCNLNRTAPFTIDLSNSTLVLMVGPTPATACHLLLVQSARESCGCLSTIDFGPWSKMEPG